MSKLRRYKTLLQSPRWSFRQRRQKASLVVVPAEHCIEDKFGGCSLRASLVSSMLNVNQKPFTSRIRGLS